MNWRRQDNWENEEEEGDDAPEDDGDAEMVNCPYCKREMYEDAERCPYCERYISDEDTPAAAKPWWVMLGVAVCLYVVYRWIVH